MNKSAKKMFAKLDYRKSVCNDGIWFDNSDGENEGDAIHFHNDKYIELLGDFEIIELDLLQAINQQISELGWLDE